MPNLFREVEPGQNPPEDLNVVIEIPLNSTSKFEFNPDTGYMELDRVMYSPFYYVYEYGFVPQTLSGDGDPLDVIVLATRPTFPGCVIRARVIGVLLTEDEEGEDNKVIAVPHEKVDPYYAEIKDIKDVPIHLKKQIEHFMKDYKFLEPGKHEHVKIKHWRGRSQALKIVEKAIKQYQKQA